MRMWVPAAVIAMSLAVPAHAAQDAKAKEKDKQDAKQTQAAVKKAREHAKKADEQPYDAMRKTDAEGKKTADKAQKKQGAGPAESDEALFARLDRNRDGFLSRAEWQAKEAEFVRLDVNRDGRLSPLEFGVGR